MKNYRVILGIVYSGIDAEIIIPSQRKMRNKFAIFGLVLIDLCFFGIPEKLDSERMVWTPGRLDSGRLEAWTLDDCTPDDWTLGLCTDVFSIFTTTVEYLNFNEHCHLLQIFTGLNTDKNFILY